MTLRMRFYRAVAAAYLTAIDATDLGGKDGRLSFQKWVLLLVLALGSFTKLSTALAIAVIAASFGRAMFSQFLSRTTITAAATSQDSRIRQIAEQKIEQKISLKRDPVLGIEETP